MLNGNQKSAEKTGKIIKSCLIVSVVLFIALACAIGVNLYAVGQTDIFHPEEFGSSLQNSQVLVDEDLGITVLGTYQNAVMAFDKDENKLWQHDIAGAVTALAYDKEKGHVIAASQDSNVYIYDIVSGEVVSTYKQANRIYDLDYDPETGRLLISIGYNKMKHIISVIDINTGEELHRISLKNTVNSLSFMPDGQRIVYGTSKGRVYISDLDGNVEKEVVCAQELYSVRVVETSGEIVAFDNTANLYRFTPELEQIFHVKLEGNGRAADASKDGRWIAAGTREGDIYVLDINGVVQFSTMYLDQDVSQVYFGENKSYIVTKTQNLYSFSTEALDNLGLMAKIAEITKYAIIALAILFVTFMIITFPGSRRVAKRFFHAIYKHKTAYLMLTPSLVLILLFQYYNVFQAFFYAFTDWSLKTQTMREVSFIGFDNFVKMITEGYFLLGVKNLIIMMVCSFAKLLTVPLLLAELVFAMRTRNGESSKRRYWFRLLLVLPMVVPGVVSTLMWSNIYDPEIGALNSLLEAVGLESWTRVWLGNEKTALWAIIFMGFPFVNSFAFLVYYGALINIPADLFEAAKVDGSNPAWNFFHIHLPLISPQMKMLIITTFIGAVQDYGGVYLLTKGGPGYATYVPGLELYYAATKFGQYGYACAMGLVMFVVILVGSIINMRMKTQELN